MTKRDEVWSKQAKPGILVEFHNDLGHMTSDCILLRGKVDHLLMERYLTKLFSKKAKLSYIKNQNK